MYTFMKGVLRMLKMFYKVCRDILSLVKEDVECYQAYKNVSFNGHLACMDCAYCVNIGSFQELIQHADGCPECGCKIVRQTTGCSKHA